MGSSCFRMVKKLFRAYHEAGVSIEGWKRGF